MNQVSTTTEVLSLILGRDFRTVMLREEAREIERIIHLVKFIQVANGYDRWT